MAVPKLGLTPGRVRGSAVPGQRMYYKPSLRGVVFRPPNVIRSSTNVLGINMKLYNLTGQPEHPATKCGASTGRKPWREFIDCLSKEFKAIIKPLPTAELAPSYAKLVSAKKVVVAGRAE